jgi:hypothetical protein
MSLPSTELPRFPDGELDLWPVVKANMPNNVAIDTRGKQRCEKNRIDLITKLGSYASKWGTILEVTRPNNVRVINGQLHDIWMFGRDPDGSTGIQVPRHAVEKRPEPDQPIEFRREVPAFLILGSMAHELAHRDRAVRDPEHFHALFDGSRGDNRHELDLSTVRHEELATDVEALRILHMHDIPLTTDDFMATVPQPADYHQELAALIANER